MNRTPIGAGLLLVVLLVALLVACGESGEATPDAATLPAPFDTASPAPVATDAIYPGPVVEPTVSGTPVPDLDPYPAEMQIWITSPAGFQCEETPRYADLDEARTALEEAGIGVLSIEETSLTVCEACGCPTSRHFRAEITYSDLAAAAGLGWQQEP